MISKIWVVNLVLLFGAIYCAIKAYGLWSGKEEVPREIPPAKEAFSPPKGKITGKAMPPESDYVVIVKNNLFRPERSEPEPGNPETTPKTYNIDREKLLRRLEAALKNVVFYGVIIADGDKKALVTGIEGGRRVRTRLPGKGQVTKEPKWVTKGDTLGEFEVKEIDEGGILLIAQGNEFKVLLYDRKRPKTRAPVKADVRPTVIIAGETRKGEAIVVAGSKTEAPVQKTDSSARIMQPMTKPETKEKTQPKPPAPGKADLGVSKKE
jgi:hypothetical protein